MVKQISIIQYRKLKGITLDFTRGINFISGTNGTCKTSLLHLISNSFKEVTSKEPRLQDPKSISIIRGINASLNPKIEALTKGDKKYNDPAIGVKGNLFSVKYEDDSVLDFRRHNSKKKDQKQEKSRYALKPKYLKDQNEKLPSMPVIYLGLTRLFPFGEFQKEEEIKKIKHKLPQHYRDELIKTYEELTRIPISSLQPQRIGDIKHRNDFVSTKEGVDANTISSGEDNIFIILTALFSLYYYESLSQSVKNVESILLIDEFDATLHPSLQESLLAIIKDFSDKYKIQVVSTTHSLSLLKHAFEKKHHVIYLCDNIEDVFQMTDPDIYKIEMKLKNTSREAFYLDRKIPVFMEDAEARTFMDYFMDYLELKDANFSKVRSSFHFVDAPFGADILRGMFKDEKLAKIMQAICILDGDKTEELPENTIALPGKKSPERLVFDYSEILFNDSHNAFWQTTEAVQNNFDRPYYRDHIYPEYQRAIAQTPSRDALKKLWNDHKTFAILVLKTWLNDSVNYGDVMHFTRDFHNLFLNTAEYHGLNKRDWPKRNQGKEQS